MPVMAALLSACGGGGDSTTSSTSTTSYTLSGTVPGTVIELFCTGGLYYRTNSTDNGTSEHPFSIQVPSGLDCHVVMTTNEDDTATRVISPIRFIEGTTSGDVLNLKGDLALGFVALEMDPSKIIDSNGDGVIDEPFEVTLPDDAEAVADPSYDALDSDGDGIPNVYEDDDNDGYFNSEDDDDDNDGYPDDQDEDHANDQDEDGVEDDYDRDVDNDGYEDDTTTTPDTTTPVTEYTVQKGRLLASQCAQCHGTDGYSTTSWDSIREESGDSSEIIEEMNEYSTAHIMGAQAIGYTDEERQALAEWLSGN